MENPSLGNYLRELRNTTSYKQIDIAVIIGKSRSSVAAYELGKTTPPPPILNMLAKIYNVSPTTMLELIPVDILPEYEYEIVDSKETSLSSQSHSQISAPNSAKMLSFFEQLSPDNQVRALNIMEMFFYMNKD